MGQVDVSTVVAILSLVLSLGLTVVMALRMDATQARDSENSRRMGNLEQGFQNLNQMVHADQLETAKLHGDVRLINQKHDGFERDVREIRDNMVTRGEWEAGMNSLVARFDDFAKLLRDLPRARGGGSYSSDTDRPPVRVPRPDTSSVR